MRSSPPLFSRVLPASRLFFLRAITHMQAGQCDSQMDTKIWELVCDENGIGGEGVYCGDNDAQLGRINVFRTRPRAASTFPARCSSTSSPA
jgi:hypothetical protein